MWQSVFGFSSAGSGNLSQRPLSSKQQHPIPLGRDFCGSGKLLLVKHWAASPRALVGEKNLELNYQLTD